MTFADFFTECAGVASHPWQTQLGAEPACEDRLIRIPTGFGKTLGVLSAWLYNRVRRQDDSWPRRLVWCLPMRVLVEQTEGEVRRVLQHLGLEWEEGAAHSGKVGVHSLMGGSDAGEWHLYPEECAVLIGTQDMLLSRGLNRGYGSPRARWPMEFGLLNHDALWVMDEVQLMDVGLATSSQLQAFRRNQTSLRPCRSWWMSATLQPSWLESVDTKEFVTALPETTIAASAQKGHLWDDVSKTCRLEALATSKEWAGVIAADFEKAGRGRLTLVVVNSVDRAVQLEAELTKRLKGLLPAEGVRLVHSRFRPLERKQWREEFLRRDAPVPAEGRLIVATQVVEAGVDLDAAMLFTELAPWPSLVQRFGRCARGGGDAAVVVFDRDAKEDKQAAPYSVAELLSARSALNKLSDVAPIHLERFEAALTTEERQELYPYEPEHLLLEREWHELFDTTPDLTGADLDISRFIRSGDERDVQVFWQVVPKDTSPDATVQPVRDALCAVPFLRAAEWLCGKGEGRKLSEGKRAWVWSWLDGKWKPCTRADLVPGRTVLVETACGGYDPRRGFDPGSRNAVVPVADPPPTTVQWTADSAQDAEELSTYPWKTIATHGAEVEACVADVAKLIGLPDPLRELLALAGRWHDYGKSHPAFQGSIRQSGRPERQDLAKAPRDAWGKATRYRFADDSDYRAGFRHELASALALFAVLARHAPTHDALLGPWLESFAALGEPGLPETQEVEPIHPCEAEVLALSADDFDLVAYLVASHHGKVRCTLHAAPCDQDYVHTDDLGLPIRGVREGDTLPATHLGEHSEPVAGLTLTLEPATVGLSTRTGRSWGERVERLRRRVGVAGLAYLEACLRAADIRASRLSTVDSLLVEVNK